MTLVSANWSGDTGMGYYPPDLKHADFVKRLLMYYKSGYDSKDIPLGSVKAYYEGNPNMLPGAQAVGFNSMNRNPRHN